MKKHKMTVATLALSLFLMVTTTVLVSCGNDDTKTTGTEPANALQMKRFALAVSNLTTVANNNFLSKATQGKAEENIMNLMLNQSKDLLLTSGTSNELLITMTDGAIIQTAFKVYAEESQKLTLKN